jgi:hypothetical protein
MRHDGVGRSRGVSRTSTIVGWCATRCGALTRLELARAYSVQGDRANARTEYQEFLTFWKHADPDIPILKQEHAEYATLQ